MLIGTLHLLFLAGTSWQEAQCRLFRSGEFPTAVEVGRSTQAAPGAQSSARGGGALEGSFKTPHGKLLDHSFVIASAGLAS